VSNANAGYQGQGSTFTIREHRGSSKRLSILARPVYGRRKVSHSRSRMLSGPRKLSQLKDILIVRGLLCVPLSQLDAKGTLSVHLARVKLGYQAGCEEEVKTFEGDNC
jgi:hypothetical protein